MSWFKDLVGGAIGPITEIFKVRQERKKRESELKFELKLKELQAKSDLATARSHAEMMRLESDHYWELEQIRNSGWKDEWVLLLLSIPLVMVFIPVTAPFVYQGFTVLATTPEWYRWLLMLIFTAIYGIRIWRRKY